MIRLSVVCMLFGVMTGCANLLYPVGNMTAEELKSVSNWKLCEGYFAENARDDFLVVEELVNRKLIRAGYITAIQNHRVQVGMNTCELLAARGDAHEKTRSESVYGVSEIWDYGLVAVTLQDGVVVDMLDLAAR